MDIFRTSPIKLSEQALIENNNIKDRVQLLRIGKFWHNGNEIEVKLADIEKMIVNFKENVRGIDLMIDYGHKSEEEAAAWIEEVYLSDDKESLWAKVNWTESGKDAVLSKKYRYLSADFQFNYKDNETLAEYGPTLFGAGLTNRPVIKKMEPIVQLSEKNNQYQEQNKMDVQAQIDELKKLVMDLKDSMLKKEDEEAVMTAEKNSMQDAQKKLSEDQAELEKKQKTMAKEAEFNKLFSEGKVVEAQRESFLNGDTLKFAELAAELNVKNKGNNGDNSNSAKDAEDEVIELAEKKMKEEKITFSESIQSVLKSNKELADKYHAKFK